MLGFFSGLMLHDIVSGQGISPVSAQ